ncbi:MAG: hypothetical protein NXI24_24495 [bacterium]|nr:hypothetical protein [bacterium]
MKHCSLIQSARSGESYRLTLDTSSCNAVALAGSVVFTTVTLVAWILICVYTPEDSDYRMMIHIVFFALFFMSAWMLFDCVRACFQRVIATVDPEQFTIQDRLWQFRPAIRVPWSRIGWIGMPQYDPLHHPEYFPTTGFPIPLFYVYDRNEELIDSWQFSSYSVATRFSALLLREISKRELV